MLTLTLTCYSVTLSLVTTYYVGLRFMPNYGLASVRTYYDEGSMMLSDDITMLPDLLLGLNSIDFRLNRNQMLYLTSLYLVVLPVDLWYSSIFPGLGLGLVTWSFYIKSFYKSTS